MVDLLIRNARVINEGRIFEADVQVTRGRIDKIASSIEGVRARRQIDAQGQWLMPGMIDDQVHFREPGAPHKGTLASESRAAVAGGITSFMDMPNTDPATLTLEALVDKKRRAAAGARANYGFHFGVSRDNLDTIAALDPREVAGVKVFMGASTGNMLVDDPVVLERLFSDCPTILLAHCEHTPSILANEARWRAEHGDEIPACAHPLIRDVDACYRSSSLAVAMARRLGTRLHVLHLTSARELALFASGAVCDKRITAEVCLHHLLFDDRDYAQLGHLIKCNPSIKSRSDRDALRLALAGDVIDVIGTDHAPHTLADKQRPYAQAPSGLPLVQHALPAALQLVAEGVLSLPKMVEKTSHAVARLFGIRDRGFVREGYWADLVLVEALQTPRAVTDDAVLAHCGWTPLQHHAFDHAVRTTLVSGQLAWHQGQVQADCQGLALEFDR
ncbi:dihydroorotase [Pseudomonas sp. S75]|uniref:dihydroorotase n=1 Tax=unclassified Pseudomonas TaxID=196821 RepID=UPI0019035231|nr:MULTISPECIES: dihydroorotase [unclassified Pseudomonas]MBJ9977693.1 dihydroorotase [Pseudomonas sp. S30]MBK0155065.1 dihydroorotase [Pseudomonas sp. S75]